MGCGASAAPLEYPDQRVDADVADAKAQEDAAAAAPVTIETTQDTPGVAGSGATEGVVIAGGDPPPGARKGGKFERITPFLPFARFDVSAVPKDLFTGDHILIGHKRSGKYFVTEDGQGMQCVAEDMESAGVFLLERPNSDPGAKITDGDFVLLRHFESGGYLTCEDDFNQLTLSERRPPGDKSETQEFQLGKLGRPALLHHEDTIFLESWVSTVVEVDTGCEASPLTAKRWKRGKHQELFVKKVAVLQAQTTELARKMQFQSIDLDGNALATFGEIGFMLQQVGSDLDINEVMGQLTEEGTGGGTLDTFRAWADSGVLTESQLQHAEALGNVAQRYRDCIDEEQALIEVITTIPTEMVPETRKVFEELTGEALLDKLITKTSEQDGYIFSNYWQLAMKQLLVPEVELWCQALQDAMDGFGTDEDTLTALVCTIPEELRPEIHLMYKERKGRSLLDHIQSETSFSYKKVLLMQATDPLLARVQALNSAMAGLGTDEQQLIRILTSCDAGDRKQMAEMYEHHYNKSLVEHVSSEISGDFKKALMGIFTAQEEPYDLDADCAALAAAMEGWGTDEAALIKLLCSKTRRQRDEIAKRFEETQGRNLEAWVKSETSSYFQGVLLGLIRPEIKQLAYAVRECIQGFGTDDTGLITLVTHLPEYKRTALAAEYHRCFKRSVLKDIKNDTSGDYQNALLACVKPPPVVWAEAMKGAMKGLGTSDALLINWLCLSKDHMDEVRAEFEEANGKPLWKWIEGDCSGDYKYTLIALAQRNSEDRVEMLPIYWAQRIRDALDDVKTLNSLAATLPGVVLKRGSEIFSAVYGETLQTGIERKYKDGGFMGFSKYWKMAQERMLEMPISIRVQALYDAMNGWGTDEYTLTGLICTIPENTHADVRKLYEERFGRKLIEHIESETSFCYKKLLVYATMSKIESRCKALNGAMVGLGTDEKQLIRIILCSTLKERMLIRETYNTMYETDLIEHIESELSGDFKAAMVAILESDQYTDEPDYEEDANQLRDAIEGNADDEDAMIRIIARKTPEQIEAFKEKYEEVTGDNLYAKIDEQTDGIAVGLFTSDNFRTVMLNLLRPMPERMAHAVRYCVEGWGTDDTGLITCCVHLSEMQRNSLIETYSAIFERDVLEDIRNDTSGDYQEALLACVRPPVRTYCHALRSSMKGLGTSDELLINWMCICKDRMDEVREAFSTVFEGENLVDWLDGDLSGDYKDTCIRCAKRECLKFVGVEVACTAQAPPTMEEAVRRFNKTFNELCRKKKNNPDDDLVIPEESQQELGCAFLFWAARSSCAPNLDIMGLWDMTNAIGFPPGDDGPDLRATFREWDVSGTGEVDWNDFVHEMTTRVNDPNHFEADPLSED